MSRTITWNACPDCGTNKWKVTPKEKSTIACVSCGYAIDTAVYQCPDCGSYRTGASPTCTLHCKECGAVNDVFVMRNDRKKYGEMIIE